MIVIPAVDIRGGRCVRLREGRAHLETVFSDDPVAMARRWAGLGAERLH
ncbi:MAG: HisA/HisF-related TIM barrel protein, partial [Candidatus Rokuibacteriota bacterium]